MSYIFFVQEHMRICLSSTKELLGHSNVKTTMVYSHVRREDLVNAAKMLDKENVSTGAI